MRKKERNENIGNHRENIDDCVSAFNQKIAAEEARFAKLNSKIEALRADHELRMQEIDQEHNEKIVQLSHCYKRQIESKQKAIVTVCHPNSRRKLKYNSTEPNTI
jgi:TolA-binding protein